MIGIYKITNKITGKVYIGQSINIGRRFTKHKTTKNFNQPIGRDIMKYGAENFTFDILELCSKQDLNKNEIKWIKFYNSNINGYNKTPGGQGDSNCIIKLQNEDILKIYELLEDYKMTQNEIAKMFNVSYQIISEINRGKTRLIPGVEYPIRKINIQKFKAKINPAPSKKIREKKHKFCLRCGKEITLNSKYCVDCRHFLDRKVERPNKDILLKEIATSNFIQVAKKYNVSDKTIVKWCKYYNLPLHIKEIKELWKFTQVVKRFVC